MSRTEELISARREDVSQSYHSAAATNRRLYLEGDVKSTADYIFPNQMDDANAIVDLFYNGKRVVSVQKKTKVGADGLMVAVAKLLCTHIDDAFVTNPSNVNILTGMSNAGWEKDMIDKAPTCFKNNIFHHGKLSRVDLMNMRNGLIIIDEIDTGDKEFQVLHNTLKEAGVLDVTHMEQNNNLFLFISATMIKELYDLYQWGDLHSLYKMTIPPSYFGHKDFLERGIVKEFYSLNDNERAKKWVKEDIIDNYKNDFRVHIVRVTTKTVNVVQNACIRNNVSFRNHTSTDRLSKEQIGEFFEEPLTQHIVLGVKGFFRRANLIPNRWKLRIGATHELFTKVPDYNVQIQGLVGRMTGYWRSDIEAGHKTGPHRTSIKAIEEYEKMYENPFGYDVSYQSSGFRKHKGKVSTKSTSTLFSPKHITNLEPIALPKIINTKFERGYQIFSSQAENEEYAAATTGSEMHGSNYKITPRGFKICSTTSVNVHSLEDVLKFTTTSNEGSNLNKSLSDLKIGDYAHRRYVCYEDINDISTEKFVTIWVKRIKE